MKLEFEEAGNLLEANRDATTISIEDDEIQPEKQRKGAGFIPDGDDEDPLASDDKAEVCTRLALFFTHFCELLNVVASD